LMEFVPISMTARRACDMRELEQPSLPRPSEKVVTTYSQVIHTADHRD
jgi:hypothetical protein